MAGHNDDAVKNVWAAIHAVTEKIDTLAGRVDAVTKNLNAYIEENRLRAEEERQMAKKREREMAELRKQLGGLGNGMGRITEGFIGPNLRRLLRQINIKVSQVYPNVEGKHNGVETEIDHIAAGSWRGGGWVAVAVEDSTYLTLEELVQAVKKFPEFFDFFPHFGDHELVGAVACMKIGKGVLERAQEEGILVIGPTDGTARILNPKPFRPKVWRKGRQDR